MKAIGTLAAAAGLVAVGLLANQKTESKFNGLEGSLEEQQLFISQVAKFGRTYKNSEEMRFRFGMFQKNLQTINEMNALPGRTHTLGLNQFYDWTHEEYTRMLGAKVPEGLEMAPEDNTIDTLSLPSCVDWREKPGMLPPIQNQGQCGSCYSFAASCSLSVAAMIAGCWTKVTWISEQYIVDCDCYDNGCNGGWEENVWSYCNANGAIVEADYTSYTASEGSCAPGNAKRWFQNKIRGHYGSSGY